MSDEYLEAAAMIGTLANVLLWTSILIQQTRGAKWYWAYFVLFVVAVMLFGSMATLLVLGGIYAH